MWRFKTESEFIADYGRLWRDRVPGGWNNIGRMDYLLGKEIKPSYVNNDLTPDLGLGDTDTRYGIKSPDGDNYWIIRIEMLIKVEDVIKENYEIY
jgi:hypothetical protein